MLIAKFFYNYIKFHNGGRHLVEFNRNPSPMFKQFTIVFKFEAKMQPCVLLCIINAEMQCFQKLMYSNKKVSDMPKIFIKSATGRLPYCLWTVHSQHAIFDNFRAP
jgi:hypothetical protein